jgi:hypothetical protein
VEKCVSCQFYDRKGGGTDGRSPQWGQCRRTSPMLSPATAKSYMIEGVWPTVRDDDWCGEWRTHSAPRRLSETLNAALASRGPVEPRIGPLPSKAALGQVSAIGTNAASPAKVGVAD